MKFVLITVLLAFSYSVTAQVVVNELLASSDSLSGIVDEYGEYDDWVELYNMGSSAVDLSDYYIAQADTLLNKWQLPAGTSIPADGYLIIWTDNDDNNGQVPLHTNFKLSAEGEMVILSDPNLQIVDQVTFGQQQTNVAYARIPNGTGDFTDRLPTPGADNTTTGTTHPIVPRLEVYPNPAISTVNIKLEEAVEHPVPYELINADGKILKSGLLIGLTQVALDQIAPGNYFIRYRVDKVVGLVPLQKH